jgi:hypothetical protein
LVLIGCAVIIWDGNSDYRLRRMTPRTRVVGHCEGSSLNFK